MPEPPAPMDALEASRAVVGALTYDLLAGGEPLGMLVADSPFDQIAVTAGAYMVAKLVIEDFGAAGGDVGAYLRHLGLRLAEVPGPSPWHPSRG